jgi:hypothetical protein
MWCAKASPYYFRLVVPYDLRGFIRHLVQKEVPSHLVSKLVGHVVQGQTLGRYSKPIKSKELLDRVVCKIDFNIELGLY